MRALLAFAALALGSFRAPAQARPANPARRHRLRQRPTGAADTCSEGRGQARSPNSAPPARRYLPDADNFTLGDRSIAANTVVDGPIAVARGNLDIYGTVERRRRSRSTATFAFTKAHASRATRGPPAAA